MVRISLEGLRKPLAGVGVGIGGSAGATAPLPPDVGRLTGKKHPYDRHGSKNPRWKGGRRKRKDGYVMVYSPGHPYAYRDFVLEHRLVVEKRLGRFLEPHEIVHHRNEIRHDNRDDNLELTNNADHIRHHLKGKKLPKRWKQRVSMDEIVAMRSQGRTIRQCASIVGLSYGAMRRHFEEFGLLPGHIKGEKMFRATMTEERVRTAREMHKNGTSLAEIAAAVGTSKSNAARIVAGDTWKHVAQ